MRALVVLGVCGSALTTPRAAARDGCCPQHPVSAAKAVALHPSGDYHRRIAAGHEGSTVSLPAAHAQTIRGTVELRQEFPAGAGIGGRLDGVRNGTFFLTEDGNRIRGLAIYPEERIAYRYTSRADGTVAAEEVPLDDVLCVGLPKRAGDDPELPPAARAGDTTALAIPSLQSRPEATAVVYLDMDGQTVTDSHWNGGQTIVAASPSFSSSRAQAIWERVSEDYRPFHINVTTDENVYLSAPQNRRIRCIITPTGAWYGNAGGVAYVGSFRWNGDTPCWVFQTGEKSAAEAISHEVGHTVGLGHDGKSPDTEYYSGHGSGVTGWAPIMGVGYYKDLVQWSKGEYTDANNTQNDLSIITASNNGFGYRADDYGNNWQEATALSSGSFNLHGVIERNSDVDAFLFTVESGNVTITVDPTAKAPNLDILAEIRNSSSALIASSNPSGTLNASFSETLPYGTYVLLISGTGKGDPLGTGYTDYASLGTYTLSGTIVGSSAEQVFTIDENPADAQLIGRVETVDSPGDTLAFSVRSGTFSDAVSVDNSGDLHVADAGVYDYEARDRFDIVVNVDNQTTPALSRDYAVRVDIRDINEVPVYGGTPYAWYVREAAPAGTVVGTVQAADPEQTAVVYAITGGNEDGFFSMDANAGIVRSTGQRWMTPDQPGPLVLQVRASDQGNPARTADASVEVTVLAHLLDSGAELAYHVPTNAALGSTWTGRHFDDSAWQTGTGGIGYDTASTYDAYIGTDVQSAMYNKAPSLYVRHAFLIPDAANIADVVLGIRFDDGFIAYLNGAEIARRNAPQTPAWDSVSAASHSDTEAVKLQYMAIDASGLLSDGRNILAIHGMNTSVASSDLLLDPVVAVTLHTAPSVRLPGIVSQWATNVTMHSADFRADVTAGGNVPSVTLYWGTTDGGTDPAAWQNATELGYQAGDIRHAMEGLTETLGYYARIRAANSAGATWANASIAFTMRHETLQLVVPGAPADYIVPSHAGDDDVWMTVGFWTRGWSQGYNAIGYERSSGYESYLLTDVESEMYGTNASLYIRIPFQLEAKPDLASLQLEMQYDDAFAAYLNGHEIAQGGDLARFVQWDSDAESSRPDSSAIVFEAFDVSAFANRLVVGDNVLAIHGLNQSTTSSDMLIRARLTGARRFRAQTYEQWRIAEAVLPEASSDPDDDPDGDGWINVLEYAFGGNAAEPDADRMRPRAQAGAGYMDLTYRRRANHSEAGISYRVRSTPGLKQPAWSTEAGQPLGAPIPDPDGISETVTVRIDAAGPARFYRLSASVPAE